jgi:hypothetical protein
MKRCFKCAQVKPLSEFYKHSGMGDGYLGKCKNCTRADAGVRRAEKLRDPNWVEQEVSRCREKARRARATGTMPKPSAEARRKTLTGHAARYPLKHAARLALNNAIRDGRIVRQPCAVCGNPKSQGHHDDYSKSLDVTWLCTKHHAERHVELRRQQRAALATLEIYEV